MSIKHFATRHGFVVFCKIRNCKHNSQISERVERDEGEVTEGPYSTDVSNELFKENVQRNCSEKFCGTAHVDRL